MATNALDAKPVGLALPLRAEQLADTGLQLDQPLLLQTWLHLVQQTVGHQEGECLGFGKPDSGQGEAAIAGVVAIAPGGAVPDDGSLVAIPQQLQQPLEGAGRALEPF